MSDTPPNTGPDPKMLKQLFGMLPSYAKAVVEGKMGGKGRKVGPLHQTIHYRKTCRVCCNLFDAVKLGPGAEITPQPGICERCQDFMDKGYIAFTCPTGPEGKGRFCFAKSDKLNDLAGKVVPLKAEVFDKLQAQFKDEWEKPYPTLTLAEALRVSEEPLAPELYPPKNRKGVYDIPCLRCVVLWSENGPKLTDQVGGFACLHPIYQGAVMVGKTEALESALKAVEEYVYMTYQGWCVPVGHFHLEGNPHARLTNRDADDIDSIFGHYGLPFLRVDRKKLGDSCEAWIHGTADGKPCLFVTANSD